MCLTCDDAAVLPLPQKPEVVVCWEDFPVGVKPAQEEENAESKEQMEEKTDEKKHMDQEKKTESSPLVVPLAECSPVAPPSVANQAAVEAAQAAAELSAAGNSNMCLVVLSAIQTHHETFLKCYNAQLCRDCQPHVYQVRVQDKH